MNKPSPSDSGLPSIRKGTSYAVARAALLSARNRPAIQRNSAAERCSGREDVCRAYPEAEACSGTGRAYCRFAWTSSTGAPFAVITVGEAFAALVVDNVVR